MSDLQGQAGEVQMTITITRKATGETETHEMIGFLDAEQLQQFQADGLVQTQQEK